MIATAQAEARPPPASLRVRRRRPAARATASRRPRARRPADRRPAARPRPSSADGGRWSGSRVEAAQDHALDRRIEIAHDRRRRRDRAGVVQLLEIGERLRVVGAAPGEDLEQDRGRARRCRSGSTPACRPAARAPCTAACRRSSRRRRRRPAGGRDAEVGDADVAVAVDHHVGRLEIAVQHAALVRRGDAGAQLPRELDRLVLRNASDAAEQRRQILAVDVLHREEAAAVGDAEVVQPARRSCATLAARRAARCETARAGCRRPRRPAGRNFRATG